jgi:hypothetical protein
MTHDSDLTLLPLLLTLGGAGLVILSFLLARHFCNQASDNPKVVLRRCKVELASVRAELMHLPACRQVHDLCKDIDRADLLIDETAAKYD